MNLLTSQVRALEKAYRKHKDIRRAASDVGINYDAARRALIETGAHKVSRNSSAKKREKILRLCGEGMSASDIAAVVGLCDHSIRRILRSEGVKPAKSRHFRKDDERLGTMSDGDLAKILGVSRQAIRQRRERRGIPPHRGGE